MARQSDAWLALLAGLLGSGAQTFLQQRELKQRGKERDEDRKTRDAYERLRLALEDARMAESQRAHRASEDQRAQQFQAQQGLEQQKLGQRSKEFEQSQLLREASQKLEAGKLSESERAHRATEGLRQTQIQGQQELGQQQLEQHGREREQDLAIKAVLERLRVESANKKQGETERSNRAMEGYRERSLDIKEKAGGGPKFTKSAQGRQAQQVVEDAMKQLGANATPEQIRDFIFGKQSKLGLPAPGLSSAPGQGLMGPADPSDPFGMKALEASRQTTRRQDVSNQIERWLRDMGGAGAGAPAQQRLNPVIPALQQPQQPGMPMQQPGMEQPGAMSMPSRAGAMMQPGAGGGGGGAMAMLNPNAFTEMPQGPSTSPADQMRAGQAARAFNIVMGLMPATPPEMLAAWSWWKNQSPVATMPHHIEMMASGVGGGFSGLA